MSTCVCVYPPRTQPAGNASKLPALWTPASLVRAAGDDDDGDIVELELTLSRLRPNRKYAATLWLETISSDDDDAASSGGADSSALATLAFTAPSSLCWAFDADRPAANPTLGLATFGVLLTPWVEPACDDWEGVIGLDAEGHVVWWYAVTTPGPADQLTDGTRDIVLLAGGDALMCVVRAWGFVCVWGFVCACVRVCV